MSREYTTRHVQAEPIPRPVVAEIAQLLGYDPREVLAISIETQTVSVLTVGSHRSNAPRLQHEHVITP